MKYLFSSSNFFLLVWEGLPVTWKCRVMQKFLNDAVFHCMNEVSSGRAGLFPKQLWLKYIYISVAASRLWWKWFVRKLTEVSLSNLSPAISQIECSRPHNAAACRRTKKWGGGGDCVNTSCERCVFTASLYGVWEWWRECPHIVITKQVCKEHLHKVQCTISIVLLYRERPQDLQ